MVQIRNDRKGFTLVEVIVVLVILAILIAISVPALTGYIEKAKTDKVHAELQLVLKASKTALGEAYGAHPSDGEVLYIKRVSENGGWGKGAITAEFRKQFLKLLDTDVDFGRVEQLRIYEDDGIWSFAIAYRSKDGVQYTCYDDGTDMTITP